MTDHPDFTLDQLVVLEAIVHTGSFAGASRTLHRVPSAISYTVRNLETALGIELFDRSGHRAVLSPTGQRVLEASRQVLQQAGQLDRLAREISGGWEPELQLVVDGVCPMKPVIAALRAFGELEIPTRLRVDVEYQLGVPERFDADQADLMIILDFEDDSGQLVRRPLPDLDMVLVVSNDHPLAQADPATEGEHKKIELVVKDSSPQYARRPRAPFLGSQHVIYLSDFHSKRLALLEGAGFGWIPQHLVESELAEGRLVLLPRPEGNRWTYHPSLVSRKHPPPGRAASRLIELLMAPHAQKN